MDAINYANERKQKSLMRLVHEIQIKRSDIIGRFQGFGVIWEELADIKDLNLYEIQQREKIEQVYQSDILNFESRVKVEKEKAEKKKKAELEKKAIQKLRFLKTKNAFAAAEVAATRLYRLEKEKAEKKKKAELEKKAILTLDYLSIEHNRMSEKLKYLETIQKQLTELQSTTPPAYIPSNNPTE